MGYHEVDEDPDLVRQVSRRQVYCVDVPLDRYVSGQNRLQVSTLQIFANDEGR